MPAWNWYLIPPCHQDSRKRLRFPWGNYFGVWNTTPLSRYPLHEDRVNQSYGSSSMLFYPVLMIQKTVMFVHLIITADLAVPGHWIASRRPRRKELQGSRLQVRIITLYIQEYIKGEIGWKMLRSFQCASGPTWRPLGYSGVLLRCTARSQLVRI